MIIWEVIAIFVAFTSNFCFKSKCLGQLSPPCLLIAVSFWCMQNLSNSYSCLSYILLGQNRIPTSIHGMSVSFVWKMNLDMHSRSYANYIWVLQSNSMGTRLLNSVIALTLLMPLCRTWLMKCPDVHVVTIASGKLCRCCISPFTVRDMLQLPLCRVYTAATAVCCFLLPRHT